MKSPKRVRAPVVSIPLDELPATKACTKCGETKALNDFYADKRAKDGRESRCKKCTCARTNAYKHANTGKVRDANREYRLAHPEQCLEYNRKFVRKYPEKNAAHSAAWRKRHPEEAAAALAVFLTSVQDYKRPPELSNIQNARRRAAKLNATPKWANEFFIAEIYALAQRRTKATGFKWHVDHIVPLRSKKVCGLHWEGNLQVIPAKQNQKKMNRYWPDMPVPMGTECRP